MSFVSTVIHGNSAEGIVEQGDELVEQSKELFDTNIEESEVYALKALELGNKEKNESLINNAYYQLVRIYFKSNNKDKAIEYAQLSEVSLEKLNKLYDLADLYNIWANGLLEIGENDQFEYYSDKSIELARQSNNYNALLLQLYNRSVRAYYNYDNYLALDYLNEVIALTEKFPDKKVFKAVSYSLLGSIYDNLNDNEQYKNYLLKSADVFEELGMNDNLTLSYSNISSAYLKDNMYASAYHYAGKSLQAQQKSETESSLSNVYYAFFNYYWKTNNSDSAVYYIDKSIEIGEQYNQMISVVVFYNDAGNFYFQLKDFDKALHYYKKAEQLSKKLETPEINLNSLKHIASIFYDKHQSDSAAYYYDKYAKGDTLKTIEKVQQNVLKLSELRIREQTEFKLKEAKTNRLLLTYSLIGSLLLVVSLSILLRKIAKQRNRINSINEKLGENHEELNSLVEYKTKQLDDKEKQYANLCDNMFNGAVFQMKANSVEPLELKFSFVSIGWEAITYLSVNDLDEMLKRFKQGIEGKERKQLFDAIESAFTSGTIVDKIFPFDKGGEIVWLHIRAALTSISEGQASLDGYMVNETEQKIFEDELITAKEKAEESDKLKTAFLSNISHEIRTPMNVITGFSNLIINNQVPEEEKESFLKTINENCFQLLQIINDIIEISKIESGQLDFYLNKVTVNDLIKKVNIEVVSLYRERYPDLEIRMNENWETLAYLTIETDIIRLVQIIDYLINNAAKFTPKGYVEFGAISEFNRIHFYVKDSGIGIAPENFEKIFDNFTKINPNEENGTGLGLSIVRKILTNLGGNIWVESAENVGSIFHFTIPRVS